jgi:Ferritin-like domain
VREMNRAQFLRLGVAGAAAAAGAGVLAAPAAAALPVPAPQGDDVGYLSFGAVGELTSLAWYRRALRVRGFSAGERRRLTAAETAKRAHIARINTALGADAPQPGDFAANFPASSVASRDRALAVGRELEDLLVGVYLNGAAFARDPATRLFVGRLLTYDAQQLAWMRGLAGGLPGAGLPSPATLEQAGARLDRLVTTPGFTNP